MEYKVSVIVPAYNAKAYLEACVRGILSQTLPEVEVIVVNDCSPDDGMEILRRLFGDNERVQLLDQPRNMGPGMARNTGIQAARGEYIAFVDSDDAALPQAYEKMYSVAKEKNADVLHCTGVVFPLVKGDPADLFATDPSDMLRYPLDAGEMVTETTVLSDDMAERYEKWKQHAYHWAVWNKLYRRAFLLENQIAFGDIKLSEDMAFCFACLFLARTYVVTPGFYYLYRVSNTSLSRKGGSVPFLWRGLESALKVPALANPVMDRVDFFRDHPEARYGAIKYLIDILENEFVIPTFQALGAEEIIRDGGIARSLEAAIGSGWEYVYHAFMEHHALYPQRTSVMNKLSVEYLTEHRETLKNRVDSKFW